MHGPSAARSALGARRPAPAIAATTASSTPPRAPFQPACAAPITPASGSARSTGPQSAVSTPRSRPGRSVTSASASGALRVAPGRRRPPARCTVHLARGDQAAPARRPAPPAARARLAAMRSGLVAAAQAHVEGGADALADAALAGEEAVPHAGQAASREPRSNLMAALVRRRSRAAPGHRGGQRHDLEQLAHGVGLDQPAQPALERRALRRRRALRAAARRRSSMPRRPRNSPWRTGP